MAASVSRSGRGALLKVLGWVVLSVLPTPGAAQQDLGHKMAGTLGLDAGSQAPQGLYVGERAFFYRSEVAKDRNGNALPVGLDLDTFANGIGIVGVLKVEAIATYVSASVALPVAHVAMNTDRPEVSIDRFGLADLYVQPLKLGWRWRHFDLGVGYGFYAPTGDYEPGGQGNVGRGQWTHQFSVGGTARPDAAGTWTFSALASYDLNGKKRGVDVTRGDTVQVQGGVGKTLFRFLQVGVAGYGLWQVRDDSGADLPPVLRGVRERAYGVGPEIGALIPPIRCRLTARYEWELGARARTEGQLFLFGLTFVAVGGERPAEGTP